MLLATSGTLRPPPGARQHRKYPGPGPFRAVSRAHEDADSSMHGRGRSRTLDGDLRVTGCAILGNEALRGGEVVAKGSWRRTSFTTWGNRSQASGVLHLETTRPTFIGSPLIVLNDSANTAGDAGVGSVDSGEMLTLVDADVNGNRAEVAGEIKSPDLMTCNPGSHVINNTAVTLGAINKTGFVTPNGAILSGIHPLQCQRTSDCLQREERSSKSLHLFCRIACSGKTPAVHDASKRSVGTSGLRSLRLRRPEHLGAVRVRQAQASGRSHWETGFERSSLAKQADARLG